MKKLTEIKIMKEIRKRKRAKKMKAVVMTGTFALLLFLTGCGKSGNGNAEGKSKGNAQEDTSATAKIDVDLTQLSSTMVYSEVFNMLYEPDNYLGKTVKMEGLFSVYHSESTGKDYFSCIIEDATACCAQGMEFILSDNYKYPDDYPKEGNLIEVVGVFDTYNEGEYQYCTLRDAKLV